MLTNRFGDALTLAVELHGGQRRKGTDIPYVSHVLSVAALVLEQDATEDEAIAALLHDAVEDAGGRPTLDRIRDAFGAAVADIVEGCSDSYGEPKPPWMERKESYLRHLGEASPSVLLVSACDKLHNARCILADLRKHGDAVWTRFNGGKVGTRWYYRAVSRQLREAGAPERVVNELDRTVAAIEALA